MNSSPAADSVQNIHIYPSDLKHAGRMFRIAKSLEKNGVADSICLVGIQRGGMAENDRLTGTIGIWRVPMKDFRLGSRKLRKIARYVNWISRLVGKFANQPIKIVNCHHIYSLPAGVLLKWKTKCLLVYDTHELETERNQVQGLLKYILKAIEKLLLPYCDQLFVVSDSINRWYKDRYPRHPVVTIENSPAAEESQMGTAAVPLRSLLRIPDEDLIFLYVGLFNHGRGIDMLIDVFSSLPPSKHLALIGYGPLSESIGRRIRGKPNIHLLPAVPVNMVQAYARAADVGLAVIENTCLSYFYSLPNKLQQYLQAGLPSIVSNFPEMSRFVRQYKCGWKTAVDPKTLAKLVSGLTTAKIAIISRTLRGVADLPHWENEEKKLLAAYARLLGRNLGK